MADAINALATNGAWQKVAANGVLAGVTKGWAHREQDICCAISGNIDWLQNEFADIQLKRDPAQALVEAYRKHGVDLLTVTGGRFSLFLWDSAKRCGVVACDRFGQMPVYWSRGPGNGLVFGPTATSVNQLLGQAASLSEQGIFNYLYFHMVPGPSTAFKGINKLLAAHALVAKDGVWQPKRYWEPDFREYADGPVDAAAEEMMGLLASSVARLASGAYSGAFLSGGLDSSTVAGLLARHQPNPNTYSIGFDAEGYDEISYARLEQLFETDLKPYVRELLYAMGAQLTQRLLHTSRKVGHLAFLDVTGRIAGTLLELCKQPDAMTHPDGMQIRITRQEIGRIVGCSREMAGRVLKNLEEQGLISVKGKTIVVFGTR